MKKKKNKTIQISINNGKISQLWDILKITYNKVCKINEIKCQNIDASLQDNVDKRNKSQKIRTV